MKRLRLLPITDASATVPVGLCPRQAHPLLLTLLPDGSPLRSSTGTQRHDGLSPIHFVIAE